MSAKCPIRVVVADDHPIVRAGIESVLARATDIQVVAAVDSGEAAVEAVFRFEADVVLMDLAMPGCGGARATAELGAKRPECRVLVLTTFEGDEDIHRALAAGASGYLLKTIPGTELLAAVRGVAGGQRVIPAAVATKIAERPAGNELTPRELEVLQQMARGLSNRQIAERLGVAESTVKTFVLALFGKLQVDDRTKAVTTAVRRGLIRID